MSGTRKGGLVDPHLLYLVLALLAVGALAGFSAGLFGIGGGTVIVPALYYTFGSLGLSPDVTMHSAVATSAAVIIVASVRSASGHHKHGAVDWALIWPKNPFGSWGLWIGAGSFLAALVIAPILSGTALTLTFGVVASIIALQLIFGRPDWQLAKSVPGGAAVPGFGLGIGGLSALMGIGGGAFCVTLMVLCGKSIHRAIGTASAIGFFVSFPAAIGFVVSGYGVQGRPALSWGYVNIPGFIIIAIMSYLLIPWGVKTAHNLSQKKLRLGFGICFLLVALNMIRKVLLT